MTPADPAPPSVPGPRVTGSWRAVHAWSCFGHDSCWHEHTVEETECSECGCVRPPLPASDAPTPAGEREDYEMEAALDRVMQWDARHYHRVLNDDDAMFQRDMYRELLTIAALRAAPRGEPKHGLGWEDDGMAQLTTCGGAKVPGAPTVYASRWEMGPTVCPVCGVALRLEWNVRAVPAAASPDATDGEGKP